MPAHTTHYFLVDRLFVGTQRLRWYQTKRMFLHSLATTDRQRRALDDTHIRTLEDLVRAACDAPSSNNFTIGMDKVFDVCNRRLFHLTVRGEDLKKDPRIKIHGKRPDTMVTFTDNATATTVGEAENDDVEELIPPEWYCPLTHEPFSNPVFIADGYTYEETSIREWLARKNTSPMTGEDLGPNAWVVPNRSMKDWIARLS